METGRAGRGARASAAAAVPARARCHPHVPSRDSHSRWRHGGGWAGGGRAGSGRGWQRRPASPPLALPLSPDAPTADGRACLLLAGGRPLFPRGWSLRSCGVSRDRGGSTAWSARSGRTKCCGGGWTPRSAGASSGLHPDFHVAGLKTFTDVTVLNQMFLDEFWSPQDSQRGVVDNESFLPQPSFTNKLIVCISYCKRSNISFVHDT